VGDDGAGDAFALVGEVGLSVERREVFGFAEGVFGEVVVVVVFLTL
jgi:hypothetical protein